MNMHDGHVEQRPKAEVWITNASGAWQRNPTRRIWEPYRKN